MSLKLLLVTLFFVAVVYGAPAPEDKEESQEALKTAETFHHLPLLLAFHHTPLLHHPFAYKHIGFGHGSHGYFGGGFGGHGGFIGHGGFGGHEGFGLHGGHGGFGGFY